VSALIFDITIFRADPMRCDAERNSVAGGGGGGGGGGKPRETKNGITFSG